ncbi:MAG: DUF3592 domain-containing protein [Candidatus Paraimprobicoccus trichonymphae]|uniref:DUF3592 domain-containing protein n=1 Tax=Candidatus Paraimprobicoccus trichonymphae TaxID=3033793 RepID=A0AA48I3H1_9FIRM|nr:MAG: DUF3592 domain-containing protein [Candidatus Paraimprobicoccus trichonymphae]
MVLLFTITLGLFFFYIGVSKYYEEFNFKKSAKEVIAMISNIEIHKNDNHKNIYTVYFEYTINDKKYESKINFYDSSMYVGKNLLIYYNPDNPNNILVPSRVFYIFIISFGLILSCVSVCLLYINMRQKYQIKSLKKFPPIISEFIKVNMNNHSKELEYYIVCRWVDPFSEIQHFFKSETIRQNPEIIIDKLGITSFPVYIDLKNPETYYLSLEKIEMFL